MRVSKKHLTGSEDPVQSGVVGFYLDDLAVPKQRNAQHTAKKGNNKIL